MDENGNTVEVARNAGEVTVFKQFDALTDRFACETLEISDTNGVSEYWSLSTAEADRSGGRITDTHIVTDVSNTGKGILIGSDTESDTYVVTGDGAAQIKVVGFDASDTIDLTSFGDDLTTSVNGSDVEVSNASGDVLVTLIGLVALIQALMINLLEYSRHKLWRGNGTRRFNRVNCNICFYFFRGLRSGSSFIYNRYTGPNKNIQGPRGFGRTGEKRIVRKRRGYGAPLD